MSVGLQFTTLNDAFFFLNQSKGMSDIPASRPLRQRYIRAAILFSWLSLEEVLEYVLTILGKSIITDPVPGKLADRLRFVLNLRRDKSFSLDEFRALRKLRNSLAHPTSATDEGRLLTVDQAAATFKYCSSVIQRLSPVKVIWGS